VSHRFRIAATTVPMMSVAALVLLSGVAGRPGDLALAQAVHDGTGVANGSVAAAGTISTVAGGVGGPAEATKVALASSFAGLCGVSYGDGDLYIADGSMVRKVSPQTDGLTTPAGTGGIAPLGDGGPADAAAFVSCATVVDHSGNLVIADAGNNRVRVLAGHSGTFYGQAMTAGDIVTIAGDGTAGFGGDGGLAASAELSQPAGVAVDSAGNVLIADAGNNRVRVLAAHSGTFYGQAMTAGDIYTIAGDGTAGYTGNGGPAVQAELNFSSPDDGMALDPNGVAVDSAGNVVFADAGNNRVRVVAARTGTFYGQAMTAGDIYRVAGDGIAGYAGDGGPARQAELSLPDGVALDGAGNLVIADSDNYRVRVVAASSGTFYGRAMTAGDIYSVAGNGTRGLSGDGGPAATAELDSPRGVAVDSAQNLVVADTLNGRVRVVAASSGTFYGRAMTAGDIYSIAGGGHTVGDGGPATSAAVAPDAVAVDSAGNLLIADASVMRVRVVAARTGTFYGRAMTAGDIYTTAGNGAEGFAGDGGPATGAELNQPAGVAVDSAGNLLIADRGNNRVRAVAASTGTFYGQAMTAGDIYTIAGNSTGVFTGDGGPATKSGLRSPEAVVLDAMGNLLIATLTDNRVRVVAASTGTFYGQAMTAGDIYTIAGNGTFKFSGDGGPATKAGVVFPDGLALDGAGNVVIAAEADNRVRVVAASSGTFYGQAMTAGDSYTVAGDGTGGFSGDGGPATSAALALGQPDGLGVDGAGNVVIPDAGNNRVRVLTG